MRELHDWRQKQKSVVPAPRFEQLQERFSVQEERDLRSRMEEEAARRKHYFDLGSLNELNQHGKRYEEIRKQKQEQRRIKESSSVSELEERQKQLRKEPSEFGKLL